MEPMAIKIFKESPELKREFEQKITTDSKFAASPNAILDGFTVKQNTMIRTICCIQ
jgi:hypothetical protein